MKFGGAVLHKPAGFYDMLNIVLGERRRPIMIVVSALGTTTRELGSAAALAAQGEADAALQILENIHRYHLACAQELLDASHLAAADNELAHHVQQARTLLRSIAVTRHLSPRTSDRILSIGEDLSRSLACIYLTSAGVGVRQVDARQIIVTNEQYGAAEPLIEKTKICTAQLLQSLRADHQDIAVTQGFVGSTESGETTTLGKESSNLTATLLGASLGAEEVVIWTDVQGVRTIDPKYSSDSRVRSHLSYEQARLAATSGLKLIYPTMITPAEQAAIPIRIASAHDPHADSTLIGISGKDGAPIIIAKEQQEHAIITVMFASVHACLAATTSLLETIHESALISVNANRHDQTFGITVTREVLSTVLSYLHKHLCIAHERL